MVDNYIMLNRKGILIEEKYVINVFVFSNICEISIYETIIEIT